MKQQNEAIFGLRMRQLNAIIKEKRYGKSKVDDCNPLCCLADSFRKHLKEEGWMK